MAKLTSKTTGKRKTTNYMGEPAYELNPKDKLVNLCATCMFGEPKYYGKVDKQILKACDDIAKKDAEFILKLAAYCRNELYLRTISTVLFVKAANLKQLKGTGLIKKYAPFILKRADEINEALACQLKLFDKPIPNSLKKAIVKVFPSFDTYQFGKYNRKTDVSFKSAIMLTHPKEPSDIIKKILDDTLETPYTWETELSEKGNKAEVWDKLIELRKLGYFAAIRNINNMIKAGITKHKMIIDYITNPVAIKNSKLLPVRFLSAYEAINSKSSGLFESDIDIAKKFKKAVSDALQMSTKTNVPQVPGKTIVICDNSGSARGDAGGRSKLSIKSARTMADTGNLMGLMTWYACDDTIFGVFGDRLTLVRPDREKPILDNFAAVNEAGSNVGGSTEEGVFVMLEKMIKDKIKADRLIVCSDLQIGDGKNSEYGLGLSRRNGDYDRTVPKLLKTYRDTINPNIKYYSICFSGYGTDVIENDRILINGWSDRIFKFINTTETSQTKYIDESYTLDELSLQTPKIQKQEVKKQ